MPIISTIPVSPATDSTVTIQLTPPTAIGGWSLEYRVTNRFGGVSGILIGSLASGYIGNVSGMTVTNSGNGIFSVQIRASVVSGWDNGAYSWTATRTDSGSRTVLAEGYLLLSWG